MAPFFTMARLTVARPATSPASGADRVSLTVVGSGASTLVTEARVVRATAPVDSALMVSSEYLTSAEVTGEPSANFWPSLRVKVATLLPSE